MAEVFKSTHEHLLDIRLRTPKGLPPRSVSSSVREMMGGPITATSAIRDLIRGKGYQAEVDRTPTKIPLGRIFTPVSLQLIGTFALNQLAKIMGGKVTGKGKSVSEASEEVTRQKGIFSHAFTEMGKSLKLGFGVIKGYVLAPFFDVVKNTLMPLFNPLQDLLMSLARGALIPLVQRILPPLQDLFLNLSRKILPNVIDMGNKVGDWLSNKIQAFSAWLFKQGGFEKITAVLGAVFSAISEVVMGIINWFRNPEHLKSFKETLFAIGSAIGKFFSNPEHVRSITKIVIALGGLHYIGKLLNPIYKFLVSLVAMKALFGGAGGAIGKILLRFMGPVGLIASALMAGYALGKWLDKMLGISDILGIFIFKLWDKVLHPLGKMLGDVAVWVYDRLIGPIIKGWGMLAVLFYDKVLKPIGEGFAWWWPKLKFVLDIIGKIVGFVVDGVVGGLVKAWGIIKPISDRIMNAITKIFAWIGKAIERIDRFLHPFSGSISKREMEVSDQSGFQAKVWRREQGIGGYKIGETKVTPIKAYALGGQVEETGLAYLHQGETVVPSSSSKDFSDGTTKEMLTVLKDIRYSGVSQIDFLRRQIDELRGLKNQSIDSILQLEVA